jgi:20S proteasome alpha/beta subunit
MPTVTTPTTVTEVAKTTDQAQTVTKSITEVSISTQRLESISDDILVGIKGIAIDIKDIANISRANVAVTYHFSGDINGLTGKDLANALQTELNKKVSLG